MSPQKIRVGSVEIISVVDTPMHFPFDAFFPDQEASFFDQFRDIYPASYKDGMFATQAATFVLLSQGKTVLCDTGIGPGPIEMLGGIRGRLLPAISEAGFSPEQVDIVMHTHLHPDHVGWNLNRDKVPNFRSATYYAPQADFDHFSQSMDKNPHMRQVVPLKDIGRLELFSGERALTDELTIVPAPGHTPGHSTLAVSSAGERAIIMGDMAHHPAQVDEIDISCRADMDREQLRESRRKLFDDAENNGLTVAFPHFPEPFGRLARSGGKRVFQAL